MKKNDKQFVLNLAEESAKLDDYHSLDLQNKFSSSDIAGWNGESSFSIKSFTKVFSDRASRNSMRTKSNSEPPMFNSIQAPVKVSELVTRRNSSIEKKLPVIAPKVNNPKVHFVHAPFPLNLSNRVLASRDGPITLSAKPSEPNSPAKNTQRQVFFSNFSNFSKKYEQDSAPKKKNQETALDVIKSIKPRNYSKVHSSLE